MKNLTGTQLHKKLVSHIDKHGVSNTAREWHVDIGNLSRMYHGMRPISEGVVARLGYELSHQIYVPLED